MTLFESLAEKAHQSNVTLLTHSLPPCIRGYYYADSGMDTITINRCLSTSCERCCVLAEELGHHFTTPVDLFTASKTVQDKYERRARVWAADEVVPLHSLVDAWLAGVRTSWELADYLSVTEPFLCQALDYLRERYGLSTSYRQYRILFDPLHIQEDL